MTLATSGTAGELRQLDLAIGDYHIPYVFGYDCLDLLINSLSSIETDRCVVITDELVLGLYGEEIVRLLEPHVTVHVLVGPPGESMKSLTVVNDFAERSLAAGASRSTVVIALGGGAVGNLAGLVAALLFRGVRLVHIPTTLVAATDSVVSLKQAVNSARGKNSFGSYHPPHRILSDLRMLHSLPPREVRSGLCEAVKNCLAIRPQALGELSSWIHEPTLTRERLVWLLEESLAAKCTVMGDDPFERRRGIVLEYGHTLGHAIELCDQRTRGAAGLSHGEAVGIGMVAAARISEQLGWLSGDNVVLHESLMRRLGLSVAIPADVDHEELLAIVSHDNKRGAVPIRDGESPFVLLVELGVPGGRADLPLVSVPLEVVAQVVDGLRVR